MGTALQKPWMKDLPQPVVMLAKKNATVVLEAWNDTVAGTLKAAKAVFEVQEKISGKGGQGTNPGSFGAWAQAELDRSPFTATALAKIGGRHKELLAVSKSLPASWSTLYELSKAPDDVFRRALRRVRPDMERNEVTCLLAEETVQPPSKKTTRTKKKDQPQETRATPAPRDDSPVPREAANTTIMAGSVWRTVKDFSDRINTALISGALSPEAKKFMVNNYIEPAIAALQVIKTQIEASEQPIQPQGVTV